MKKIYLLIILFFEVVVASSQNYWIDLKYPMSGILGRAVKRINKGDPIWEPTNDNSTIKFISYTSADEITEYSNKFRSFISKFFDLESTNIKNISVKKLVIRAIDIESIKKMTIGSNYIYEGITADTVNVEISVKKDKEININKIAETITKNLNEKSTEIVPSVLSLLDSITLAINDSFTYKMTIINPNVYYKVRVVTFYKRAPDQNNTYEDRWQFFPKNGKKDSVTRLQVDATGIKSQTDAIFPYSDSYLKRIGTYSIKNALFKLVLKSSSNELKLFIYAQPPDLDGSWVELMEVPFEMEENLKIWKMDRKMVFSFLYKGFLKIIYIQVTAKQVDAKTIEIINWNESNSRLHSAYTFMQYPEVSFIYQKK